MKNVLKITLLLLFSFLIINNLQARAIADSIASSTTPVVNTTSILTTDSSKNTITGKSEDDKGNNAKIQAAEITAPPLSGPESENSPLLLVLICALAGGLLTVFTPYVYAFVPMTISTLVFRSTSREEGNRHTLYFACFIVAIFTALGALISIIFGSTGLHKLTANWIFNLFFCRFLAGLGLSMLGAFDISLPMRLIRATHSRARSVSTGGLFFMALTLPVATFSSTFPLVGLVLVLAGKGGIAGPVAGMFGFSIGIASPFLYPRLINLMPASALNYVKVILGFALFFLGVKFFSNADVAKGWHILDRDMFILIWILVCVMIAVYMLGWVKFTNDYVPKENMYGQEYVSLTRLFIVIAALTFAIYLLPGIWGAPLKAVSSFLPPAAL